MRTTGLAVAMALALTASVGVASASASLFEAAVYPATVTGVNTNTHELTTGFLKSNCTSASVSGVVSAPAETITLPLGKFAECTVTTPFGKLGGSIAPNGCDFKFYAPLEGLKGGTMDIVGCNSPSTGLTMNVSGFCTLRIPQQTGIGPVNYANVGTESERKIQAMIEGNNVLDYTIEGFCGKQTGSTGSYEGTFLLSGSLPSKGIPQQDIWLS